MNSNHTTTSIQKGKTNLKQNGQIGDQRDGQVEDCKGQVISIGLTSRCAFIHDINYSPCGSRLAVVTSKSILFFTRKSSGASPLASCKSLLSSPFHTFENPSFVNLSDSGAVKNCHFVRQTDDAATRQLSAPTSAQPTSADTASVSTTSPYKPRDLLPTTIQKTFLPLPYTSVTDVKQHQHSSRFASPPTSICYAASYRNFLPQGRIIESNAAQNSLPSTGPHITETQFNQSVRREISNSWVSGNCGAEPGPDDSDDSLAGEWSISATIEGAHTEKVWCLAFAPLEFGMIVATCSSDRVVGIWKEVDTGDSIQWIAVAKMRDARRSISCVQFAPPMFGLYLVACSYDGYVRTYDSQDHPKLHIWSMEEQINCHADCNDPVCISLSICCDSASQDSLKFAVIGRNGTLKLWARIRKSWDKVCECQAHLVEGKDVAWCPNICRPFDILATCGVNPCIALWRFEKHKKKEYRNDLRVDGPSNRPGAVLFGTSSRGQNEDIFWGLSCIQKFNYDHAPTWKVKWNLFGTHLAGVSGDKVVIINQDGTHWIISSEAFPHPMQRVMDLKGQP